MIHDIETLAVDVGGENYILRFRRGHAQRAAYYLLKWALNPRIGLSRQDAVFFARELMQRTPEVTRCD